jgi:hypothetical protein
MFRSAASGYSRQNALDDELKSVRDWRLPLQRFIFG